jgi:hypothetical protein
VFFQGDVAFQERVHTNGVVCKKSMIHFPFLCIFCLDLECQGLGEFKLVFDSVRLPRESEKLKSDER